MSYNESVLKELLDLIPQTGKLEWIGIRPGKKQALTALKSVRIEPVSYTHLTLPTILRV